MPHVVFDPSAVPGDDPIGPPASGTAVGSLFYRTFTASALDWGQTFTTDDLGNPVVMQPGEDGVGFVWVLTGFGSALGHATATATCLPSSGGEAPSGWNSVPCLVSIQGEDLRVQMDMPLNAPLPPRRYLLQATLTLGERDIVTAPIILLVRLTIS